MNCLYCGDNTRVTNSRLQKRYNTIWRRRKCLHCSNIFSTIERPDLNQALRVEFANNSLSPFDRDNLYISVYDCLKHRNQPVKDATELTHTIITRLTKPQKAMISRQKIIRTTLNVLQKFDNVAYVQYKAFHEL